MFVDEVKKVDLFFVDIKDDIIFCKFESLDGLWVYKLIVECKLLDENFVYCNLLQCIYFVDILVVVEMDGDLVGFIFGYILFKQQNMLFVWQVVVYGKVCGKGFVKCMLVELIKCDEVENVQFIEIIIILDNEVFWGMFCSFVYECWMFIEEFIFFDLCIYFVGEYNDEYLLCIGLFNCDDV